MSHLLFWHTHTHTHTHLTHTQQINRLLREWYPQLYDLARNAGGPFTIADLSPSMQTSVQQEIRKAWAAGNTKTRIGSLLYFCGRDFLISFAAFPILSRGTTHCLDKRDLRSLVLESKRRQKHLERIAEELVNAKMVKEVKTMSAFHDDLARVFPITFQFAATITSGTYWSTIPHKLVNPIHAEMDTAIRSSIIDPGLQSIARGFVLALERFPVRLIKNNKITQN